jgi:hypothetical protein
MLAITVYMYELHKTHALSNIDAITPPNFYGVVHSLANVVGPIFLDDTRNTDHGLQILK